MQSVANGLIESPLATLFKSRSDQLPQTLRITFYIKSPETPWNGVDTGGMSVHLALILINHRVNNGLFAVLLKYFSIPNIDLVQCQLILAKTPTHASRTEIGLIGAEPLTADCIWRLEILSFVTNFA